jgi:hypothetical protein
MLTGTVWSCWLCVCGVYASMRLTAPASLTRVESLMEDCIGRYSTLPFVAFVEQYTSCVKEHLAGPRCLGLKTIAAYRCGLSLLVDCMTLTTLGLYIYTLILISSLDLSISLSIYLSICVSVCLSLYLSLSIYLSVYLSICLSISVLPSICLSLCLSICACPSGSMCLRAGDEKEVQAARARALAKPMKGSSLRVTDKHLIRLAVCCWGWLSVSSQPTVWAPPSHSTASPSTSHLFPTSSVTFGISYLSVTSSTSR